MSKIAPPTVPSAIACRICVQNPVCKAENEQADKKRAAMDHGPRLGKGARLTLRILLAPTIQVVSTGNSSG